MELEPMTTPYHARQHDRNERKMKACQRSYDNRSEPQDDEEPVLWEDDGDRDGDGDQNEYDDPEQRDNKVPVLWEDDGDREKIEEGDSECTHERTTK